MKREVTAGTFASRLMRMQYLAISVTEIVSVTDEVNEGRHADMRIRKSRCALAQDREVLSAFEVGPGGSIRQRIGVESGGEIKSWADALI